MSTKPPTKFCYENGPVEKESEWKHENMDFSEIFVSLFFEYCFSLRFTISKTCP